MCVDSVARESGRYASRRREIFSEGRRFHLACSTLLPLLCARGVVVCDTQSIVSIRQATDLVRSFYMLWFGTLCGGRCSSRITLFPESRSDPVREYAPRFRRCRFF